MWCVAPTHARQQQEQQFDDIRNGDNASIRDSHYDKAATSKKQRKYPLCKQRQIVLYMPLAETYMRGFGEDLKVKIVPYSSSMDDQFLIAKRATCNFVAPTDH